MSSEGKIGSQNDEGAPLLATVEDHYERGYNFERSSSFPKPSSYVPSDRSKLVRTPVHFHSIEDSDGDVSEKFAQRAMASRYRYYNKLARHAEDAKKLTMPDHVVPSLFLIRSFDPEGGSQASWVTIFSLWNTMMGTSLLSIPWAINQAGFVLGIFLLLIFTALMLYSSYRVLQSVEALRKENPELLFIEFHDVCRHYLGRWSEVLALFSGLITFLGAMLVYWILMSNFLYETVSFIYHHVVQEGISSEEKKGPVCRSVQNATGQDHTFYMPYLHDNNTNHHDNTFQSAWHEQHTVPFFLLLIVGPLVNFKSPTFFTKLNALGALTVSYLLVFTAIMASKWGLNFSSTSQLDVTYVPEARALFPALTGVAAYGLFGHSSIPSITRTQKNPENNVRDIVLAYVLVLVTFLYTGIIFYVSFPLDKDCIEDNMLKNVADTNEFAFVGRIGLFVQCASIYPLIAYVFRLQFMTFWFGTGWPSWKHVVALNAGLVTTCVLFAVFLPHIGQITAFVGAFCGFSYGLLLPCLVYMKMLYIEDSLTWRSVAFHSVLIFIGLANFVAQFVINF